MTDGQKPPPMGLFKAFLAVHVFLYRLSGGRLLNHMKKAPVFILTVKGRKSGRPQTLPLLYTETDRGLAVVASFAGAARHPAWYLNLMAAKEAEIEIGRTKKHVRVEEVETGSERYRAIWQKAASLYPDYDAYQTRTTRQIPILELIPV